MSTDSSSEKQVAEAHGTTAQYTYEITFVILAVFTAIELLISDFMSKGQLDFVIGVIILISLALIKVLAVVSIFMHVRYENKRYIILAVTFGLPLFLALPVAIIPALG